MPTAIRLLYTSDTVSSSTPNDRKIPVMALRGSSSTKSSDETPISEYLNEKKKIKSSMSWKGGVNVRNAYGHARCSQCMNINMR